MTDITISFSLSLVLADVHAVTTAQRCSGVGGVCALRVFLLQYDFFVTTGNYELLH